MIQLRSILEVADKSGAKRVQCVKVLGGSKRKYAGLGDIIVVSVKEAIPERNVKKGAVVKGVSVRLGCGGDRRGRHSLLLHCSAESALSRPVPALVRRGHEISQQSQAAQ